MSEANQLIYARLLLEQALPVPWDRLAVLAVQAQLAALDTCYELPERPDRAAAAEASRTFTAALGGLPLLAPSGERLALIAWYECRGEQLHIEAARIGALLELSVPAPPARLALLLTLLEERLAALPAAETDPAARGRARNCAQALRLAVRLVEQAAPGGHADG